MKSLNLTFEDKEFKKLKANKEKQAKKWEDYILELAREEDYDKKQE